MLIFKTVVSKTELHTTGLSYLRRKTQIRTTWQQRKGKTLCVKHASASLFLGPNHILPKTLSLSLSLSLSRVSLRFVLWNLHRHGVTGQQEGIEQPSRQNSHSRRSEPPVRWFRQRLWWPSGVLHRRGEEVLFFPNLSPSFFNHSLTLQFLHSITPTQEN